MLLKNERTTDGFALYRLQIQTSGLERRDRRLHRFRKKACMQRSVFRHVDHALHAALQLPHVAGPVVVFQQTQGLGGAARKLSAVADTLSDIADTVNAVCQRQLPPKGETFDFVVEQVARTTCQSCTRRSRCWVRGYATAMDGLYHLKPTLESKGLSLIHI